MTTIMIMPIDDECPAISSMDNSNHDIPETSFVNMSGEDSLEACLGITKNQIEPVSSTASHDQSFERELEKMVASLNDAAPETLPVSLLLDDSSSMIEASQGFLSADKNAFPKSKCLRTSFDNVLNQTPDILRQSPTDGIITNSETNWLNINKIQNTTSIIDWPHEFALPKSVRKRNREVKSKKEKLINPNSVLVKKSDNVPVEERRQKKRKKCIKKVTKDNQTNKTKSKCMRMPKRRQEKLQTRIKTSDFEMDAMDCHRLPHDTSLHIADISASNEVHHNEETKSWTNSTDNYDVANVFDISNKEIIADTKTIDTLPVLTQSFPIGCRSQFISVESDCTATRSFEENSVSERDIINIDDEDAGEVFNQIIKTEEQTAIGQIRMVAQPSKYTATRQRIVLPKPPAQQRSTGNGMVVFQFGSVQPVQNVNIIKVSSNQCFSSLGNTVSMPLASQSANISKDLLPKKPVLPKPVGSADGLSEIQLRHPTIVHLLSAPCKAAQDPITSNKIRSNSTSKRMLLKPKKIVLRINLPDKMVLARKSDPKHKPLVLQCHADTSVNEASARQLQSVIKNNVLANAGKACIYTDHNLKLATKGAGSSKNGTKDQSIPKIALWKKISHTNAEIHQRKPHMLICKKRSSGSRCVQTVMNGNMNESMASFHHSSGSNAEETLADKYMSNWKPTGQFQCNICNYSSVTVNFLFRHWLVCHNGLMPYRCCYCDFQAGSRYIVTRHQSYNHRDQEKCVVVVREVLDKVCQEFEQAFGSSIRLQGDSPAEGPPAPVSYQCSLCSIVAIRARMICHCMLHFNLRAFTCATCDFRGEDAECVRFHYLECHPGRDPRVALDLDAIQSMERATGLTLGDPVAEIMQAYGLEADLSLATKNTHTASCLLRFSECT